MFAPEAFYIAAAILSIAFLIRRRRHASRLPLPPGPRGWPLIANLFDWPFESAWIPFAEWSKKFGDIIHIEVFGMHIVILSSFETANSLMSQASYSDRPILTMVGKLMNFTPSIVLAPYGEHWKAMRRVTQQSLNRASSQAFLPSQLSDARLLLQELLVHPDKYIGAIRYALGKNIIENTYGIKITSPSSEYVKLSRETHEVIQNAVVPGSFFVDVFPAPKAAMAGEDSMVSLVGNLLSRDGPEEMTRDEYEYTIKWAAGSLYGAGTESTTSSITTFLLTMVLFPDVQKRVQAELDSVLGGKRLPTFEDRASLPYLEATIKESLRFHPPTPLGIAHRLSEDDVVQGYHIPKGSIIMPNIWAMNMNEKQYRHPERFDPTRYLGPSPALESPVFGFGRRACLGVHYSTAAIFITVSSLLSVFDLRAQDKEGRDLPVEPAFTGGFVRFVAG
ncbi:cytochrome P450 [Gloeopeniophorella convolvens]|nr:cytochrome P450 [Gloeopeniophorella convolvens]